ncbi:MAG: acyltransferase [Candidatus Electrothrix sp. AUS1_2]|nr:acyltransferase [Candidatus Electrothrix sp. AUS1_2]
MGIFINKLLGPVMDIIWPSYMKNGNEHSVALVFKYWLVQKIFRINSHVPWPVHPTSTVMAPKKIYRGTRTPGLSPGNFIDGRNGIIIGKNVWIGPRVSIISMDHNNYNYAEYIQGPPIIIQDNCLLCANCIILPGVTLGKHTIVAAGAVVTKSFTEGNIVLGGVPAKILKRL